MENKELEKFTLNNVHKNIPELYKRLTTNKIPKIIIANMGFYIKCSYWKTLYSFIFLNFSQRLLIEKSILDTFDYSEDYKQKLFVFLHKNGSQYTEILKQANKLSIKIFEKNKPDDSNYYFRLFNNLGLMVKILGEPTNTIYTDEELKNLLPIQYLAREFIPYVNINDKKFDELEVYIYMRDNKEMVLKILIDGYNQIAESINFNEKTKKFFLEIDLDLFDRKEDIF